MAQNGAISNSTKDVRRSVLSITETGKPPLPMDHGWAWVVMITAFLNTCFIMLFIRSAAVLFLQFLEKYQESATMTTLAFGLCSVMFALCNICGPTFLLHRFEVRTLACLGASINCVSIFLIAFAPNMIVIDLLMACVGCSHGFICVPQMTLLGHYFSKRLSFSTAFVNLGLSIGTIAGPPLTQFLLDTYGLQGTVMILAGINMNCLPTSILLRPVSLYAQPSVNNSPKDTENVAPNKNTYQQATSDELKDSSSIKNATENHFVTGNVYAVDDINLQEDTVSFVKKHNIQKPHISRSISENAYNDASQLSNDDRFATVVSSHFNLQVLGRRESKVSEFIDKVSLSGSVRYFTDSSFFMEGLGSSDKIFDGRERSEHEELFPMIFDDMSRKSVHKFDSKGNAEPPGDKITWLNKIRKSMSGSIYVHPLGILLLVAIALGVHTQTTIGYMPALGKENGLTDNEIPYLITVIGICDLVSKLGLGVFADLGYVKRIHIVAACAMFGGVLMQFVRFFRGFGLMILLQVLLGLTVGVTHAMAAVIVVDILGVKYMGHIMAGYFLVNGIVTSIEHVIIGSIKDATGSFIIAYNYIGSVLLLSAFLFLLEPMVAKLKPAPK